MVRPSIMPVRRATNPVSHRLARASCLLGLAAALAVGAAGPLYRFERIDLDIAQQILRYGGLAAIGAALLGLATAIAARPGEGRRGFVAGALGIMLGLAGAWLPMQWLYLSRTLPPIHDISTDTIDPPVFVAVAKLHPDRQLAYEGRRIADLQRQGYSDIAPVLLAVPASEAIARAEKAAAAMGWHIVEVAPREGRIEAVARTLWFGFEDDVVIRVRATAAGSRIDMRSRSRVGVSDLGANAERIRRFAKRVSG
jgi:uncharacterized protein (DUF1499 family)